MSERSDAHREGAHSDVEWLDVGPPPLVHGERRPLPPWRWWYALVALALVAGITVSIRTHQHHSSAASHPSPSPSLSVTPTPSAPASDPDSAVVSDAPSFPAASISVTAIGHPLLNVPPTWELFGLGPLSMVSIQLEQGKMTTTPVPLQQDGTQVSFVVGSDRAIIVPSDSTPGYQIPNGQNQTPLPNRLAHAGVALPGPDPDHVWVMDASGQRLQLVGLDGVATSTYITVPGGTENGGSDNGGYVLFYGVGGVYDLRPSGITRITTGTLLAAGPTRWLVSECDAHYRCTSSVIDRATGASHQLPVALSPNGYSGNGLISPDGRTAILVGAGVGSGTETPISLVNLTTGASRKTNMAIAADQELPVDGFVWSPDSRWVFATGGTGVLYAINAATGVASRLPLVTGPLFALALRVNQ